MKNSLFYKFSTSLLLILTFNSVASAEIFPDVPSGTSYYNSINWAYDKGIIKGYTNGNFGPNDCVKRAELLKMIEVYKGEVTTETGPNPNFKDVKTSDWFYIYVRNAKFKNWIDGYKDGYFGPNRCVNRAEAMKIATLSLLPKDYLDTSSMPIIYDDKVVTDISIESWYAGYARRLFKNRLIGTNHTLYDNSIPTNNFRAIKFFPSEPMTRKEIAEMLYRIDLFLNNKPANY